MVRTLEQRTNEKIDKKIRQKPRVSYVEDALVEVEKKSRGRKRNIINSVNPLIPKRKYVRKKPLKMNQREILTVEKELIESDDTTTNSIPCESNRESMDNEYEQQIDELKEEIMEEYKKVKKRYDQIVLNDGYAFFDPSFQLKIPKVKIKIPEKIRYPHNRSSKPAIFRDTSGQNYHLNRGSLTFHTPLPIMKYWSHTNINIVGKDECSLSHVPYLGDGEDDPSFTDELLNTYEEGIHGEKIGWGKKINDFILFHTVSPILSRHNWNEHSKLLKIMYSIYDLFPNKNSAKEMAQNYADLVARFTPNKSQKTRLFDDLGELKQNFTPAMMQSSNRNLLCKRCYLIDCIIHPTDVTSNDVHIERAEKASDDPKEPCGNFCYRNSLIQKPSNKKSPRKKSNAILEVTVTSEEPVEWTPHEESVISLLRSANMTSICRLASLLGTICRSPPKTCKQVYDYINGKGPFSPIIDKGDRGEIEKDGSRALVALNHRVFRVVTGGQLNNEKPYVSCNHIGECSAENHCTCRKENRMCNKFCGCPTDCRHRFPGCRCKPGNCRTNQCQCFFASWECDPDMCHSCNCDGTDDKMKPICKNINIQRCLQRKLYIAPSTVAGTGCYTDEFIPKGEYIGEYVGEIISQMEAERRGKIYDKFKCSYLFTMNSDQAIDATRVGNIMRFVNHSKHPNCAAKVMIVNGDHHIAFFANADIRAHEELFFDYSYNSNQLKEFVYIEKKRPVNSNS